ncbi:MAG: methylenetetrahydrofolate reductase [Burkholderiaceae bacterium]
MTANLAAAPDRLAACEAELMIGGSLEMSPERADDAKAIAALLPAGTRVYVNHLPNHGLAQSLAALASVRDAGLEPVPHIAARRIVSRSELSSFLGTAVREMGVGKVLLIGGDDPLPAGPYADAIEVLRERVLADSGLREVGLPGYPEGHPRIPQAALDQALVDKLALAAEQGLGAAIVTQFSFAPARIVEYCAELARKFPGVPVYVGMAGPTNAATLLRFAQRCGVSASLRAMGAQGMGAVRLFMHTEPSEQLRAVAQYCLRHADCNVAGAHLFSFGAVAKSAAWMNRVITSRAAPA